MRERIKGRIDVSAVVAAGKATQADPDVYWMPRTLRR